MKTFLEVDMKWFVVYTFTFFFLNTAVCAEKLYVSPDQVHVGNEGILVHIQGNLLPVNGIFRDAQGLHCFVDGHHSSTTCPLGHPSEDGSGLCENEECEFSK